MNTDQVTDKNLVVNTIDYKSLSEHTIRLLDQLNSRSSTIGDNLEHYATEVDSYKILVQHLVEDANVFESLRDLATKIDSSKFNIPVDLITKEFIDTVFILFETYEDIEGNMDDLFTILNQIWKQAPSSISTNRYQYICSYLQNRIRSAVEEEKTVNIAFTFKNVVKLCKNVPQYKDIFLDEYLFIYIIEQLSEYKIDYNAVEFIKFITFTCMNDDHNDENTTDFPILPQILNIIMKYISSSDVCIKSTSVKCVLAYIKSHQSDSIDLEDLWVQIKSGISSVLISEIDIYCSLIVELVNDPQTKGLFIIADLDEFLFDILFKTKDFRPGNYMSFTELLNMRITQGSDIFGELGIMNILNQIHFPAHYGQLQQKIRILTNLITYEKTFIFENCIDQETFDEFVQMITSSTNDAPQIILMIGMILCANPEIDPKNPQLLESIELVQSQAFGDIQPYLNSDCIKYIIKRPNS